MIHLMILDEISKSFVLVFGTVMWTEAVNAYCQLINNIFNKTDLTKSQSPFRWVCNTDFAVRSIDTVIGHIDTSHCQWLNLLEIKYHSRLKKSPMKLSSFDVMQMKAGKLFHAYVCKCQRDFSTSIRINDLCRTVHENICLWKH